MAIALVKLLRLLPKEAERIELPRALQVRRWPQQAAGKWMTFAARFVHTQQCSMQQRCGAWGHVNLSRTRHFESDTSF